MPTELPTLAALVARRGFRVYFQDHGLAVAEAVRWLDGEAGDPWELQARIEERALADALASVLRRVSDGGWWHEIVDVLARYDRARSATQKPVDVPP